MVLSSLQWKVKVKVADEAQLRTGFLKCDRYDKKSFPGRQVSGMEAYKIKFASNRIAQASLFPS